MVYEVKDILRDVRIAIDENKTNEQLITDEDIDTLMLDDISIVRSWRGCVGQLPTHLSTCLMVAFHLAMLFIGATSIRVG